MTTPAGWRLPAAIILAAALGGCASVPQASGERDAEAKQFIAHPNSATLYVYRNDFVAASYGNEGSVLYVGNRLIGSTLARTYFRVDLPSGDYELHGYGHDYGRLKVSVLPDEITFVELNVVNGVSHFRRVNPETGRRAILGCCTLMEDWAPGQRPLLR